MSSVDVLFNTSNGDAELVETVTTVMAAYTLAAINASSSGEANFSSTRATKVVPTILRQWPDWSSARAELKWTWMVHTYGFACVFFMLAFYAFFSVLNLRAQLSTRPYMSSINVFLCVLGSARAICFLVDPYQSKRIMPTTLGSILWDLAFPSLISAFGLIQLAFLQLTRLRLGPAKLRSKTCMSLVITSHFFATIAINIVSTYRTDLKVVRVVCQSAFLVWGGLLCVAFLHGGFHTMRLLKQAPNSMFQRSDSSGFESKVMALGVLANCPNLAAMTAAAAAAVPSFLAAPKIRITDENEQTYSYVSDNSLHVGAGIGSGQNNSAPPKSTPKSRERRRPSTPTPAPASPTVDAKVADKNGSVYTVTDGARQTILKKQSANLQTTTPSSSSPRSMSNGARPSGPSSSSRSKSRHHNQDHQQQSSRIRKTSLGSDVSHSRQPRSSAPGLLGGIGLMAGDVSLHRSSNGTLHCSKDDQLEMNLLANTSGCNDSPLYGDFKQDVTLMSILNHIAYVNRAADDYSFDAHKLRPKSRKNQIEKVLQGTYASAVLGFLLCALEAFRIYGPYGLLAPTSTSTTSAWSRSTGPAPWPWFIFQTVCRFVELSMGCFMANITKQPVNRHHYPYAYHMKHRGGGLYF